MVVWDEPEKCQKPKDMASSMITGHSKNCFARSLCTANAGLFGQLSKEGMRVGQKHGGRIKFRHTTRVHHQNFVVVQDGVQAMGNGQQGAMPVSGEFLMGYIYLFIFFRIINFFSGPVLPVHIQRRQHHPSKCVRLKI